GRSSHAADFVLCWPALAVAVDHAKAGPGGASHADPASRRRLFGGPPRSHFPEDTGVALSVGSFRLGCYQGGDGQNETRVNVHGAAGFVRDAGTVVTNFLLPVRQLSFRMAVESPRVAESSRLQWYILWLTRLRRQLKFTAPAFPKADKLPAKLPSEMLLDVAKANCAKLLKENNIGLARRGAASPDRVSRAPRSEVHEGALGVIGAAEAELPPRQREAHDRVLAAKAADHEALSRLMRMQPAVTAIEFSVEGCQVRCAFSHIPLWHALINDIEIAQRQLSRGAGLFPRPVHALKVSTLAAEPGRMADKRLISERIALVEATKSRPFSLSLDLHLRDTGLVLCNDKPSSYGAPDVLQASFEDLRMKLVAAKKPLSRGGSLGPREAMMSGEAVIGVNYLNDSYSHWERAVESWRVQDAMRHRSRRVDRRAEELAPVNACWTLVLMSKTMDPVFKDTMRRSIKVASSDRITVCFHPSLLLTLGDLLAFSNAMFPKTAAAGAQDKSRSAAAPSASAAAAGAAPSSEISIAPGGLSGAAAAAAAAGGVGGVGGNASDGGGPRAAQQQLHTLTFITPSIGDASDGGGPRAAQQQIPLPPMPLHCPQAVQDAAPSMDKQMGLSEPLTSRVPTRITIHNMTGSPLHYWAGSGGGGGQKRRKEPLQHGKVERLQVEPLRRVIKIVGLGGLMNTSHRTGIINVKLDGSWKTVPDVVVDIVGKYVYNLENPAGELVVPLIVDVDLVGRTKVVRLHSALYACNRTDLRLSLRLHIPSPWMAYHISLLPGEHQEGQEIVMRPLAPGEGAFLPLIACLSGVVSLQPANCKPSAHDVLRLSPTLEDMWAQQGYVTCAVDHDRPGHHQRRRVYHNNMTFAVKVEPAAWENKRENYEALHPGEFTKAFRTLEAQITIAPTVELTNSLPYPMLGYIIANKRHMGRGEPEDEGVARAGQPPDGPPNDRFPRFPVWTVRHSNNTDQQHTAAGERADVMARGSGDGRGMAAVSMVDDGGLGGAASWQQPETFGDYSSLAPPTARQLPTRENIKRAVSGVTTAVGQ
ncbi:hypothetical protein FOA52_012193, partial [Chlamydomonas sp. UWO 241]